MQSDNVFRLDQLTGFIAAEAEQPPLVYFSGPLTWYADKEPEKHREVLALADAVQQALAGGGFVVHVPHRDGGHEDDRDTYSLNRGYIARSSLVVAYYDLPSTGLGQELEVAALYTRPVVLLVKERRNNLSTMIRSAFFAKEIVVFDDHRTLAERLPPIAESLARPPERGTLANQLGTAVQRARVARGMTQESLAAAAGCSSALVRDVETGDPSTINVSLIQINALALALGTDGAALLELGTRAPDFERRVIEIAARTGRSSSAAMQVLDAAARQDATWDESDASIARLFDIVDEVAGPESAGEG